LRFAAFLVIYDTGRFSDQYFRGDFQPILGPFSLTQVISILLIVLGLTVFYQRGRHGHEIAAATLAANLMRT
jgi:prolipoprotein diacylglyceryltransferase